MPRFFTHHEPLPLSASAPRRVVTHDIDRPIAELNGATTSIGSPRGDAYTTLMTLPYSVASLDIVAGEQPGTSVIRLWGEAAVDPGVLDPSDPDAVREALATADGRVRVAHRDYLRHPGSAAGAAIARAERSRDGARLAAFNAAARRRHGG